MSDQQDKCYQGSVLVIGLGLIGGSLAKGLKKKAFCESVLGYDQLQETMEKAVDLQVIDGFSSSLADVVQKADIIVIATPVLASLGVLKAIKPHLKPGVIISDVGSVKGIFVENVNRVFQDVSVRCVPAHPIAGAEMSGVEAANHDLFLHHRLILTPYDSEDKQALQLIRQMWECVGAQVDEMNVNLHDEVLARTSHLPHLLAFSLVSSLAEEKHNVDVFEYAAGGFRDFTRIAESDPHMWHDIFLANKLAVLEALDLFKDRLNEIEEALKGDQGDYLLHQFKTAQHARRRFSQIVKKRASMINEKK